MANIDPVYPKLPIVGLARIESAAAGDREGGSTVEVVVGATPDGTRIDVVWVKAAATTTDGMVRFFLRPPAANIRMVGEIPVTATTASATAATWEGMWVPPGGALMLPPGWKLEAATEKSESFNVFAFGGNLNV